MERRDSLKSVVKFARKEYEEKRPINVKVIRVKPKSILTRGLLPSLNIKHIGQVRFVVLANYGKNIRVYFFSKNAQLMGGQNIEKDSKSYNVLMKNTRQEYSYPKDKEEKTIDDITRNYRDKFKKEITRVNQIFGLHISNPYVIEADPKLSLGRSRQLGTKIINEKILKLSVKLYQTKLLKFVIDKEIFHLLVNYYFSHNSQDNTTDEFYSELALFLVNVYGRNRYNKLILNILGKEKKLKYEISGKEIKLTETFIKILKERQRILPKQNCFVLLKNFIHCFVFLRRFGIKLNNMELSFLFLTEVNIFRNNLTLYSSKKNVSYTILLEVFLNIFKKYPNSDNPLRKKHELLVLIFSILAQTPLDSLPEWKSVSKDPYKLRNSMKKFSKNDTIQREIENIKELQSLAIKTYIINQLIDIEYETVLSEDNLSLTVTIANKSEIVFRDFIFEIEWKPKKRVKLIEKIDEVKAMDLHKYLKRQHTFLIQKEGIIKIYCKLGFQNPLTKEDSRLNKNIKLGTVKLEIHKI